MSLPVPSIRSFESRSKRQWKRRARRGPPCRRAPAPCRRGTSGPVAAHLMVVRSARDPWVVARFREAAPEPSAGGRRQKPHQRPAVFRYPARRTCREAKQARASGPLPAGLGSYCVRSSARPDGTRTFGVEAEPPVPDARTLCRGSRAHSLGDEFGTRERSNDERAATSTERRR